MKELKICLLFIILLLPISVFAETCDNNNVIIKNINQTNKSEGTDEKSEASIENNKINLDITMSDVEDYIEYQFNVENKSDEEFAFNEKSITSVDNHFTYEFSYEDDSNIIPANGTKKVTLKITYATEIEEDEFNSGVYQLEETNKLKVMDPKLLNPKTANYFYMIFVSIFGLTAMVGVIIIKNKYMKTFLFLCCLIPTTVYATCSYEIELNTNIEVSNIPFSTDSWQTIIEAVRNNNTSSYNIGDTKEIELEGYGTKTIRLVNKSTPEECNQDNFSQTACGFVLEFTDILGIGTMNSDRWVNTDVRSFVNNEIYNALPQELKDLIIDTKVLSSPAKGGNSLSEETTDKIYLLAAREYYSMQYDINTRQLDYYVGQDNFSFYIKEYNNSPAIYWTRSGDIWIWDYYWYINDAGSMAKMNCRNEFGIVPAFRIG